MAKHNKRDATTAEYVDAIPDDGGTDATIAEALGLTPDRARKSLLILVSFGIVRREGELFKHKEA